jgi:amidohydrolase
VSGLQTITSRNVAPLETAVVSVTTIHSGTAFNVIPQTAELSGTVRTFDPAVRKKVLGRFESLARGIGAAMGCDITLESKQVTPAVINDAGVAERCQEVARRLLPGSDLSTSGYITMGAEDMAFMQEKVPGCYFFVGSSNAARHLDYGHHHPKFDFDEDALPRAAGLLAAAAADMLKPA